MKKIPNWLIIIIVIVLITLTKFIFFPKKEDKVNGNKVKQKAPIAVNYVVVKPVLLDNTIFATGKIGSFNNLEIFPEVSEKFCQFILKKGKQFQREVY